MFRLLVLGLALFSLASLVAPAEDCSPCDPAVCKLPDCACALQQPDAVPLNERPQIVLLSYDDAFTQLALDKFYFEIFDGDNPIRNPDGCPIRATHFVSHYANDYTLNHKYYQKGHEFSVHSITHRTNLTYWATMDTEQWRREMVDMKKMLSEFALIPEEDIIGMRAPFLQTGGNNQFALLANPEYGFQYDCSLSTREFGYLNMANGIWPHTLDYCQGINCQIEPCPDESFPGIWEQPILDLEDNWFGIAGANETTGQPCGMLDSCIYAEGDTPEVVKEMLLRNFMRAYNGNTRAPFGVFVHAAWFYTAQWRYDGYKLFLQHITDPTNFPNKDVWVLPVREGIEYMKNPKTYSELLTNSTLPGFGCSNLPVLPPCPAQNCKYYNVSNEDIAYQFEIDMKICSVCPEEYPWLDNPLGEAAVYEFDF